MFIPYGDDIQKPHPPIATIFLMAVNGLVSMYEYRLLFEEPVTGSRYRHFIEQWGLIPHELAQGKVMGLLSGMFLHADLAHLLGNLFTMWLFAWTIEVALGSIPFVIMYLSWGIAAGVTQAAVNWDCSIPCVGASGAIFGIVGAYFVTFGVSSQLKCLWNGGILTGWKFVKFEIPAGLYVFFWLLVPQVIGLTEENTGPSAHAGVAWYAHAGGFVAGMLCMTVFGGDAMRRMRLNREGKWEIQSAANGGPDVNAAAQATNPGARKPDGSMICPYCRTALDESNKIDNTLYRCPNPECRRLTYLT
jgi:membrane associated rhomboid family serine protease